MTTAGRSAAGEIPLLDADRLDDHAGIAARGSTASSFGDVDDDRAINRLITKLKKTSVGAKASEEKLQDMAIDLYNQLCDPIRTRTADPAHIDKAARLFGESADHLKERLAPKAQAAGGESALLKALAGS